MTLNTFYAGNINKENCKKNFLVEIDALGQNLNYDVSKSSMGCRVLKIFQ